MTIEAKFTPGPWRYMVGAHGVYGADDVAVCLVYGKRKNHFEPDEKRDPNARLIAAAPELYEACKLLEKAELFNANCEECNGEGVPELCEKCFPLFDDARLKRMAALQKARGAQ